MMDTGVTKSGRRRNRRNIISILVTTSHPTSDPSTTSSNHSNINVGGALTLFCPRSGTIQSSTRIHGGDHNNSSSSSMMNSSSSNYTTKGPVGVSHISMFPQNHHHLMGSDASSSTSSSLFAMAYGASTEKSTDSYGMFISIRRNHNAATVPPYVHWKCRLPEANMSGGLLVSPVTLQHVIGGGHSGTLYVWNTFANGSLIRIFPSVHYRAITCMTWATTSHSHNTENPWNSILVTAGADGMVHCFSHLDLVDATGIGTLNNSGKIQPIRSWTKHHLPVTSLISIHQGSRIISSGEDGLLVIMELCSGSAIATIQLPHAIQTLQVNHASTESNLRLFAGSNVGCIYIIDLDTYAIHSTMQMGATMIQIPSPPAQQYATTLSMEDQVFGTNHTSATTNNNSTNLTGTDAASSNRTYQSELRGHDYAITSLVVFHTDDDATTLTSSTSNSSSNNNECLISGDEMGVVRMWDTRRGCCLRVLYPWSSAGSSGSMTKTSNLHPVTSIQVIYDASDPYGNEHTNTTTTAAMFGGTNVDLMKRKRIWNFADRIAPLQKFANDNDNDGDNTGITTISVPFLQSRNTISSLDDFWDVTRGQEMIRRAVQSHHWKRPRQNVNDEMRLTKNATLQVDDEIQETDPMNNNTAVDGGTLNLSNTIDSMNMTSSAVDGEDHASLLSEVERLKQQLDLAQQTIVRWELVNNKLMERLNHSNDTTPK